MGNQVMDAGGNPIVIASSSGAAYIGGNELMVTFGDPSWGTMTPALNDTDRAGTFMHELGHTLGLNHGGDPSDGHNDKPNYKSVMNYTWQFPDAKNRFTVRTAPYGPGRWTIRPSSLAT